MARRTNRFLCEASFVSLEHYRFKMSVDEAIECTRILFAEFGLDGCRVRYEKSYKIAYYSIFCREVVYCRQTVSIGTVLHEVAHALDFKINKPRFRGTRRSTHDNLFYHSQAVVYSAWFGREFKHFEDAP